MFFALLLLGLAMQRILARRAEDRGLAMQRDLDRKGEEHGRQIEDLSKAVRQLLIPPNRNPIGFIHPTD